MSGTGESDQLLRQFERDGVVACVAMAAIALVVERGRFDGAAGVLAGGAISAASYWAIKGGVDVVVAVAARASRKAPGDADEGVAGPRPGPVLTGGRRVWLALKFFTRYALLAVVAYVMLSCFRVHPVGLLAGATTPFVAAAAQVVRSYRASARRKRP